MTKIGPHGRITIRRLYAEGMDIEAIAERFGVSRRMVADIVGVK